MVGVLVWVAILLFAFRKKLPLGKKKFVVLPKKKKIFWSAVAGVVVAIMIAAFVMFDVPDLKTYVTAEEACRIPNNNAKIVLEIKTEDSAFFEITDYDMTNSSESTYVCTNKTDEGWTAAKGMGLFDVSSGFLSGGDRWHVMRTRKGQEAFVFVVYHFVDEEEQLHEVTDNLGNVFERYRYDDDIAAVGDEDYVSVFDVYYYTVIDMEDLAEYQMTIDGKTVEWD